MIVLSTSQPSMYAVNAVYQIIRRNGAVVSFDPAAASEARMQWARLRATPFAALMPRASFFRGDTALPGARVSRLTRLSEQAQGFFSSQKVDGRNAPQLKSACSGRQTWKGWK